MTVYSVAASEKTEDAEIPKLSKRIGKGVANVFPPEKKVQSSVFQDDVSNTRSPTHSMDTHYRP